MENNPLKDLKWFLLALVVLWAVWYFTGGPSRFEMGEGPFLRPPTLTGDWQTYGKDIKLDQDITVSASFLSSGIKGIVYSNPCTNVSLSTRCNDNRQMILRITRKKDGNAVIVKDITIGKDGNFKIGLPPDQYIIWQKAYYKDVSPYQNPMIIKVKGFKYKEVNILFDNKIR